MKKIDYQANKCECCGQTTEYLIPIDKGAVVILRKIATAIRTKGINCIHLAKENVLTHSELCNIIRPRFHGLVAHVEGEGMKGNFCLTRKGLDFLKGKSIPKYAIVSKTDSRLSGYFRPDECQCNAKDLLESLEYWEGAQFDIVNGRVVYPHEWPVNSTIQGI